MANRKRYYNLPDYKTVTTDIDVYVNAWRAKAEPIERELGLKLSAFDPSFVFVKGTADTNEHVHLDLPVWFVEKLSNKLSNKQSINL